jgi:hypothetical protein
VQGPAASPVDGPKKKDRAGEAMQAGEASVRLSTGFPLYQTDSNASPVNFLLYITLCSHIAQISPSTYLLSTIVLSEFFLSIPRPNHKTLFSKLIYQQILFFSTNK